MSVLYVKLYRFAHKPETKEAFVSARDAALRSTSPQENEIIWQYWTALFREPLPA
jgi:hypothetical protein